MIQQELLSAMSLLYLLGMNQDNFDSLFEYQYSNQFQSQNRVKLGNCLIHRKDHLDNHHGNHNLLRLLHKEFQMHKNLHLQELYNNNQLQSQNRVKLGNCWIHNQDQFDTHHENHNLLHFQNKCYNCRIHHLHCLKWHSQLNIEYYN